MKAHIVTIGDEILIGQVLDSNSQWLAELMNLSGIKVHQITSISDIPEHITETLQDSIGKYDIVLLTGGLGPTKDDLTKATLSDFFKTKLVHFPEVEKRIFDLLRQRGIEPNDMNKSQAYLPENARIFPNSNGTASGMWFEIADTVFVSMPGVPFEMKAMFEDAILPALKEKFITPSIYYKTVLTQGVVESHLAEYLHDWEENLPAFIKLAYLPQPGIVRLRLTASGNDMEILKQAVIEEIETLKGLLEDKIFGYDDDTLEAIVGKCLRKKNLTLATAESCTGGYIAHLITSVSGSSDYFKGSIVSYSNEIKTNVLDVESSILKQNGAVSQEVVELMASNVKEKFKTDCAIAVSGIAGPTGGTSEKPVGLVWIAVVTPKRLISEKYLFGNHRERNIRRSALQALNMLRKELL